MCYLCNPLHFYVIVMLKVFIDVTLLVVGIVMVLWGADGFVSGASGMARRWRVSEMLIGLTVVAMGTSMPEFVVSLISALKGSADMSAGNVVGSNVFNTLMLVGVSSMFLAMSVERRLLVRDILFVIYSSVILVALAQDASLSRWDALVLLMCFSMYMIYSYNVARSGQSESVGESPVSVMGWGRILLFIVLGIFGLVAGGQLLVSSASSLAREFGMSERVIGLTILAVGTSLPELATSIVAARRGSVGLALGNAIGSNLFNIFFVLGASAFVCPMRIKGLGTLDWVALVGSAVVLFVFGGTGRKITRMEGFVMIALYFLYMTALVAGWKVVLTL